ncbi:MAG TPA: hypothetical protein DD989_20785, partial [Pseudomonas sp.]|nr:hypothetical protein [Pseudomonas sp.]
MNETLKAAGNLGAELGAAMAENARLRGLLRDAAITLDGWRNTDELDELAEKITAALSRQAEPVHDLYRTSDEDAPESIKDRNGEVVLDLCRKCGRGEVELKDGCKAEPAPAQDEREAFNRALHSQKVFKLSSATIDAAEWAWFARPAQTEQQTIMQGLRIVFDGPPDHDAG